MPTIRLLFLVAVALFAAPVATASETFMERRYPVPDHGDLILEVPVSWHQTLQAWPGNLPTAINFKPDPPGSFSFTITPWTNSLRRDDYGTSGMVREFTERQAAMTGGRSPSNPMAVEPMGGDAIGFTFVSVDHAVLAADPVPGRYGVGLQGYLMVGGLLCHFMVFSIDPDDPDFGIAERIIRQAQHRP